MKLKNWGDAVGDFQASTMLEPHEQAGLEGLKRALAFNECCGLNLNGELKFYIICRRDSLRDYSYMFVGVQKCCLRNEAKRNFTNSARSVSR